MTGTGGDDSFSFTAGSTTDTITFDGAQFSYSAAQLKAVDFIGTGLAAATLTGLGNDSANVGLGSGTLTGAGYTVTVSNVNALSVNAGGSGGVATMQNSAAVDHLFASGNLASLSDSSGRSLSVNGFSSVTDNSTADGSLTKNIAAIDFALKTL